MAFFAWRLETSLCAALALMDDVCQAFFLACSSLAASSLRDLSIFRVLGIGAPSAASLRKPIVSGPSGRISGFFTQVQFGPPIILLFCSGMSFMAGRLLLP